MQHGNHKDGPYYIPLKILKIQLFNKGIITCSGCKCRSTRSLSNKITPFGQKSIDERCLSQEKGPRTNTSKRTSRGSHLPGPFDGILEHHLASGDPVHRSRVHTCHVCGQSHGQNIRFPTSWRRAIGDMADLVRHGRVGEVKSENGPLQCQLIDDLDSQVCVCVCVCG